MGTPTSRRAGRIHRREPVGWELRPRIDTPDELWFGPGDGAERETSLEYRRRVLLAKEYCAECPLALRRHCLEQALQFPADEQYGVVAGLDHYERRALLTRRGARPAAAGKESAA
ncbi:WhiB family transcriptional regulator [Actinomadura rupiterrae]|uniref:WhiB family transcriptional regulator n=1 Tax=Actinomadura rupiterrae TaxID=559627 RepID=UPI0020A3F77D|nr:WhiB family transcriptional regulator [Actinomadura rupiterrae]MCP2340172.1 hypothetical protein [Actinomadura rupiterrae]